MKNNNKENKKNIVNNVRNNYKDLSDVIINMAVAQYKAGILKSSMDVESFIDSLLQPLMC